MVGFKRDAALGSVGGHLPRNELIYMCSAVYRLFFRGFTGGESLKFEGRPELQCSSCGAQPNHTSTWEVRANNRSAYGGKLPPPLSHTRRFLAKVGRLFRRVVFFFPSSIFCGHPNVDRLC